MLTQEEAAYICAAEEGIDLHKYLPNEKVKSIRDLRGLVFQNTNISPQLSQKTKIVTKDKIFNFDKKELNIKDSLLPEKFLKEAKDMMVLYAKTYIFENSVRNIIRIVMRNKLEDSWWTKIDINIQNKVKYRKSKEVETPWISKRGGDELCYVDVSDLKKIMDDNWSDFSKLGDKDSLFNFFNIIERIRNIIAHHNIVEEDDRTALGVYLKNWTKAVESNKDYFKGLYHF
jgi:hypothetical protein